MRKKLIQARASALNEVAAHKGGNVFVLASSIHEGQPVYDHKSELSSHLCEDCGSEFATLAEISAFCPNCGSGETEASEAPTQTLPITDEQLSAVNCPSCQTANILHDSTAKVMDGHLHCVTCGTDISFEVQAEGMGSKPVIMEKRDADGRLVNDTDPKFGDAAPAEIMKQADEHKPQVNAPVMSRAKKYGKETADEKSVMVPTDSHKMPPLGDVDVEDIKKIVNKDLKAIPSVQAAEEPMDDPMVEELDDDDLEGEDQDMPMESAAEDDKSGDDKDKPFGGKQAPPFVKKDEACESTIAIPVLSTLLMFKGGKSLQIASVGDKVMAFVNDKHVATLTAEKAGESANLMHTASFAKAVGMTATKEGLTAAFAAFKFDLAKVNFPQKAVMSKLVAKATKAEAFRLRKETAAHEDTFMQCLSIAAAGLNKGFFKNEENALKRGFYDVLSAAGVKGAERIIDQVFAKFGDTYHKTLLTTAQKLMDKPIEVRNSMAETVLETAYQMVKAEEEMENQEDEQEEDATALTARLSNPVTPARSGRATTAQTATVRELAGGGSFFKRS